MARTWSNAALLVGVTLSAAAAPARGEDLAPGVLRAAQSREGAWLRDEPKPLGKRLARVPYGERVKVVDVREYWVQVTSAAAEGPTGWLRANEVAEPGSLTVSAAAAPVVAASDVSAAGRQMLAKQLLAHGAGKQFDLKTENTYRVLETQLDAAYKLVDQIERDTPTDAELEAFIREGRLGGTDVTGTPNGVGAYAKLKMLGATGNTEGVTVFSDEFTPLPEPVSDAEFVQRLGVGFSPEHEYWLGRSVAAAAIAEHGLDPDTKRQMLVRRIGGAIALLSDRLRTTHGGWHFAVLNAAQPNGISGPGGFVLLTRGALDLARNEDEIAGVIAHEMAHVAYKHGEQMVRHSREFQAQLAELERRITAPAPGQDCNLCGEVARTLGTSAKTLVKTLDTEGYGRDLEMAADWAGSLFLCEVGYRASAVAEYLEMVPTREGARWTTHPTSEERIEALRPLVFKHGCPFDVDGGAQARLPRFRAIGAGAGAAK